VRYAAPPVGNLRFSPPTAPEKGQYPVFNDGSKAVSCIQAVPYWTVYTTAWVTNGTAAFNISEGYQPPDVTFMPPQDPQMSEDCLFLDVMVPKKIFDNANKRSGAPVYAVSHPSACNPV
jgi:cholinesterase